MRGSGTSPRIHLCCFLADISFLAAIIAGISLRDGILANSPSLDPLDTSAKKKKRLHAMVSAMYHVTFEERFVLI